MGGDLTQVLRRPVELAVISGHLQSGREMMRARHMVAHGKRSSCARNN